MGFVAFLDKRQKEYVERFCDETIEMTDFCIRFQNMPKNKEFEGSEMLLKARLWN
jgi:hypothetical protein